MMQKARKTPAEGEDYAAGPPEKVETHFNGPKATHRTTFYDQEEQQPEKTHNKRHLVQKKQQQKS